MDDQAKKYQFPAAIFIVVLCLAYLFICAWHKPEIDLTAPVLGVVMLLLGYYWGSSKSSQDKGMTIDKQIQNAADVAANGKAPTKTSAP